MSPQALPGSECPGQQGGHSPFSQLTQLPALVSKTWRQLLWEPPAPTSGCSLRSAPCTHKIGKGAKVSLAAPTPSHRVCV